METGPQNNNAPPVERIPLSRARIYSEFLGKEHEREAIRSFIAELPTAYDLVITDRRCGIGRMEPDFAEILNWDTTAIESDADYFHETKQVATQIKARKPDAAIRVYQQSFLDLDVPKYARYFDIVALINGPFYYLTSPDDRASALKTFRQTLQPGGILLLDMANFMYLLHNLGPVGERRLEKKIDGHHVVRVMTIELNWHTATWTHIDEFIIDGEACYKEQHVFAICSPPEVIWMLKCAGFENIRTYNSWHSRHDEQLNGGRIMISAQKPKDPR